MSRIKAGAGREGQGKHDWWMGERGGTGWLEKTVRQQLDKSFTSQCKRPRMIQILSSFLRTHIQVSFFFLLFFWGDYFI